MSRFPHASSHRRPVHGPIGRVIISFDEITPPIGGVISSQNAALATQIGLAQFQDGLGMSQNVVFCEDFGVPKFDAALPAWDEGERGGGGGAAAAAVTAVGAGEWRRTSAFDAWTGSPSTSRVGPEKPPRELRSPTPPETPSTTACRRRPRSNFVLGGRF